MRYSYTALLLLLLLWILTRSQNVLSAPAPGVLAENYDELIQQATDYLSHGFAPSAEVIANVDIAYQALEADKEKVSVWMIQSLARKAVEHEWNPMFSSSWGYGIIFWRFGPEYVLKLAPTILKAKDEELRIAGAGILGNGQHDAPAVASLAVQVLQRDTSPLVKNEVLHALANLPAPFVPDAVIACFNDQDSRVRTAAVQYFWLHPEAKAVPGLTGMLATEQDATVGFWLAWTMCRNHQAAREQLLTSTNTGVCAGTCYFLANEALDVSDKELAMIVARSAIEQDSICQYEMAEVLAEKGDPRCISLFISVLSGHANIIHPYRGSNLQPAVNARLWQLLPAKFTLTDDDLVASREKQIYARVAIRYASWWAANKDMVRWDKTQMKFLEAPATQPVGGNL